MINYAWNSKMYFLVGKVGGQPNLCVTSNFDRTLSINSCPFWLFLLAILLLLEL